MIEITPFSSAEQKGYQLGVDPLGKGCRAPCRPPMVVIPPALQLPRLMQHPSTALQHMIYSSEC